MCCCKIYVVCPCLKLVDCLFKLFSTSWNSFASCISLFFFDDLMSGLKVYWWSPELIILSISSDSTALGGSLLNILSFIYTSFFCCSLDFCLATSIICSGVRPWRVLLKVVSLESALNMLVLFAMVDSNLYCLIFCAYVYLDGVPISGNLISWPSFCSRTLLLLGEEG